MTTDPVDLAGAIVCYARCWGCQFGQCPGEPHTWMDDEDIEHAGLPMPRGVEEWQRFAAERPCGCHCMRDAAGEGQRRAH